MKKGMGRLLHALGRRNSYDPDYSVGSLPVLSPWDLAPLWNQPDMDVLAEVVDAHCDERVGDKCGYDVRRNSRANSSQWSGETLRAKPTNGTPPS